MRKFYLENEYGVRLNLNSPDVGFLTSPSGLGYSMKANYVNIGNSYLNSYMNTNQADIKGTLVFGGRNPYESYEKYVDFVNSAQKLRIVYVPFTGEYFRDVDMVSIDKGEMGKGVLSCTVSFKCRSLFYINKEDRFVIERSEGELRFDFRWPARFNDYSERTVIFDNKGHVPASFTAEIFGYTENPVIEIVVNGAILSKVQFDVILQERERILYSSLDGDLYCYKIYADGRQENIASTLDINNTNFFKLPTGECLVLFTSTTGVTNKTIMQIYQFYKTV